jgi:hypothetical protein
MNNLIAQNPFGTVNPPPGVVKFAGGSIAGVSPFITVLLRTLIVGIGIYALLNFLLAGYGFLGAGGDPKKIEMAWAKIWQSILGVVVAAGAFILIAILGLLLFGQANYFLYPQIYTP